jgi:RimJ/RimL family protein N-acetyltransferase
MEFPKDLPSSIAMAQAPVAEPSSRPAKPHWVPIRPLAQRHRGRILFHLLALNVNDRYLRFGYAASDTQVERYVDLIDFDRDEVFGIFNRRLELIAQAHLAALPGDREAEFGVSVLPKARGRGYGARLFDRALLHARNHGIDSLVIHALTQNVPMLRIVRAAGATVERAGGESTARLRVPRDDFRSHLGQLVETGAAEIDYQLKVQAQRTANVLDVIDEVRTSSMAPGQAARE